MATIRMDDEELVPIVEQIAEAVLKRVEAALSARQPTASSGFAFERMTYDQVADVLGRKPQTIRSWVSRGLYEFPKPVPIGSKPYILRSELEAWLQSPSEAAITSARALG